MIGNQDHAEELAALIKLVENEPTHRQTTVLRDWPQEYGFSLIGQGSFRYAFLRDGYVYKVPKFLGHGPGMNIREQSFFEKLGNNKIVMFGNTKVYLPPFHCFKFFNDSVFINCMAFIEKSDTHTWADWLDNGGFEDVDMNFHDVTGTWSDLWEGNIIFCKNSGIPALIDP